MSAEIFNIDGKVALITGAASGIGQATAHLFLRSRAHGLLLVDLSSSALESSLSDPTLPEDARARCEMVEADVTSEEGTIEFVSRAIARWGKLDIAVLNAGVCEPRRNIVDTDLSTWERLMSINSRGVFLGIKHCARAMMQNPGGSSGSIVVISSQLGLEGAPGLSAYSASKFAVRGLALTTAEELAPYGIRVNTVCPGPILTPLLDAFEKDERKALEGRTLVGRLGSPGEVASAVLFLAGKAGGFCVGTTLKIDGGYAKFG